VITNYFLGPCATPSALGHAWCIQQPHTSCFALPARLPTAQVEPRDDRFQAVRTFRFIGFLLARTGQPCPALWDPEDPERDDYGRHDRVVCQGGFQMAAAAAAAAS
jgi:hypothetical protein